MTDVVMAIGDRTDNAQLIADCHQLGYINGAVCDLTYGKGVFWKQYRPDNLTAIDIDPARHIPGICNTGDFTKTWFRNGQFNTVVLDPPYKLNGTSTGKGASAADARYGVTEYKTIAERHQLICRGISEGIRILAAGGHLIVKCQDQVSSGKVQWQTDLVTLHATEGYDMTKVDLLHVCGYRRQPSGRRQLHARRDYSSALVFRKGSL